jgi:hypothetical protein
MMNKQHNNDEELIQKMLSFLKMLQYVDDVDRRKWDGYLIDQHREEIDKLVAMIERRNM